MIYIIYTYIYMYIYICMYIYIYIYIYIHIYIYINFVCQCSMSIYTSKIRHYLILNISIFANQQLTKIKRTTTLFEKTSVMKELMSELIATAPVIPIYNNTLLIFTLSSILKVVSLTSKDF